jgi:phage baseplate assembly protein W
MSARSPLGKGLRFPVVPDQAGALDYAEGPDKVRQAILLILDTDPGERIMRPAFGCGLRRYLMKPNTVATRALIQRDVERSIGAWEPRVQVTSVGVTPGDDPAQVYIAIAYVHARDRRPGNLVYPFYLE